MTTIQTRDQLIARSIRHDEIAHHAHTDEIAAMLAIEAEDSVDAGERVEYWGTTDDGEEWRVHLDRAAE